jgi:hypothetical protein
LPPSRPDPTLPLEAARQLWGEQGRDNYEWHVARECFCPGPADVRVTIDAGEVTEAVASTRSAGEPDERFSLPIELEPDAFEPWFTVDGQFELAEEIIALGWRLEAVYDSALGYPLSLRATGQGTDAYVYLSASGFTASSD